MIAHLASMLFRRKSRYETAMEATKDVLAEASKLIQARQAMTRRTGVGRLKALGWLGFAAPVLWLFRGRLKGIADTTLKSAQNRLTLAKQEFMGGAEGQPSGEREEKQEPQGPGEKPKEAA